MWKSLCQFKNKAIWFGIGYLLIILVFAFIYWKLPSASWKENSIAGFADALYYSVVTITTWGFGDICPLSLTSKMVTCIEVIIGVVIIGLFLNAIAAEQAETVDENSKIREDKKQKDFALAKLLRHIPLAYSKIQPFLLECYEVITPIDKRNFPDDILTYSFVWKFNDMHDLYSNTLLLTNPFLSNTIENYFRTEHELYEELKYLNSNADLQLYPDLQNRVCDVLNECSSFTFEPAIVGAKNTYTQDKDCISMTLSIKKMIENYNGDLSYKDSNLTNAYIALHRHLEVLIPAVQKIAKIMKDIIEANGCAIINK